MILRSRRRGARLYVPELGTIRPTYDRIEIVSPVAAHELWQALPIRELKRAAHHFYIRRITNPKAWYSSRIVMVSTPFANALWLLFDCEPALELYSVSKVEIAFDVPAGSVDDAREKLEWLACHVHKRNHYSGKVRVVSDTWETPPDGCINLPTFYYEHPNSTIALKLYARYEKLPGGEFGGLIVRLEWTLRGSAIERHLNGKRLANLVVADLGDFLEKQLCLEQVDHDRLELLLSYSGRQHATSRRRKSTKLPAKFQRLLFSIFAHTGNVNETWTRDESELIERIRRESPAHIRGQLRRLRDGGQEAVRTGSRRSRRRMQISQHQIDRCFHPIPVEKEPSP